MKLKRNIITAIIIITLLVAAFVAIKILSKNSVYAKDTVTTHCDVCKKNTVHDVEYSTLFESTTHEKKYTCKECKNVKIINVIHEDTDEKEGVCDFCGCHFSYTVAYCTQCKAERRHMVTYSVTDQIHIPVYTCQYANCGYSYLGISANHVDNNKDGECDTCGYVCQHDYECKKLNNTYHTKTCKKCGNTVTEKHDDIIYSRNSANDETTHYVHCRTCKSQWIENHNWKNGTCQDCKKICKHDWKGGKCTYCNMTCNHNWKETGEYLYRGDGRHSKKLECSECGIVKTDSAVQYCIVTTINEVGPTCTKAGSTGTKYCKLCNQTIQEPERIEPLGHDYKNATCTEPATCRRCGVTSGKAAGHLYVNGVCTRCNEKEPVKECIHDWENTGKLIYNNNKTHSPEIICKKCGKVQVDTEYENCKIVTEPLVEATCTEAGRTEKQYCSECNGITKYATKINALGHNYSKATCTEPATCTRCGETTGEALGHNFVNGVCTICKEKEPVQECEHDWENTGKWVYNNNKTHSPEIKCKKCGTVKVDTEYENCKIVTDPAVEATCTEAGRTEKQYCSKCNGITKYATKINALGHNYSKATCTEPATCTRCGETTGEALGHNFVNGVCTRCEEKEPAQDCEHDWENTGKWVHNGNNTHSAEMKCKKCGTVKVDTEYEGCRFVRDTAVPATCVTDGKTEGFHCKVCNNVFKKQEVIKAPGHQDIDGDGICDVCKTSLENEPAEDPNKNPEKEPEKEEPNKPEEKDPENTKNPEEKPTTPEEQKQEEVKKCEHVNKEWKADNNEHWQVCKDCGEVIANTKAGHTYEDGKCKVCGSKESETASNNKMPYTGVKSVIPAIAILSMLSIVGAIYFKKF